MTSQDMQQLLDPGMALLEYFVGDTVLYVFYLDAKTWSLEALSISKMQLES